MLESMLLEQGNFQFSPCRIWNLLFFKMSMRIVFVGIFLMLLSSTAKLHRLLRKGLEVKCQLSSSGIICATVLLLLLKAILLQGVNSH